MLEFLAAAFFVVGSGAVAAVICLLWDTRLERRQGQAGVGLSILRTDDHDDATEAELYGMAAALAAIPADLPLSALPLRREPVLITPSPLLADRERERQKEEMQPASRAGWGVPPRPRPEGHGPFTLQFIARAVAETGVVPELGPRERPTWVSWGAVEMPLLVEVP